MGPDPQLLESLFTHHLKARLEKEAIAAIRPAIQAAVADAARELAPAVQLYLDQMKNEMVVQLVTKEIPAK